MENKANCIQAINIAYLFHTRKMKLEQCSKIYKNATAIIFNVESIQSEVADS